MSQPIDIPLKQRKRQKVFLGKTIFPAEEGPYLGYIEVFESGDVYRALSAGSGKFVEVGPRCPLPTLAFIVEKDRVSRTIALEIVSANLKQAVHRAIPIKTSLQGSSPLSFDLLLKHYDALKAHLERLKARSPFDDVTAEMRLLVQDLMLERALYEGIGIELLRQKQVLCATLFQDVHARNISIGLDEIEGFFALGIVPDESIDRYLEALNLKYAELARSGDYTALRNLCEPIVRSGEIELQYNPSLLLEVLDKGYLDIYQYMLDLVDRTKSNTAEVPDPQFSDVTFDPFYVAIRLGQLDTVQSFIDDNATFEGYVFDDGATNNKDCIFTPLTASVHWQQVEVARLLLNSGPIYTSVYPQASCMALANGSEDMIQLLLDHPLQATPSGVQEDFYPTSYYSQSSLSVSPQTLQLSPTLMANDSLGNGKSVSGITNALFSLNDVDSHRAGQSMQIGDAGPTSVPPGFKLGSPLAPAIVIESATASQPDKPPDVVGSSNPSHEAPLPFARHTSNHQARKKLGRTFADRLKRQCTKVKQVCDSRRELPEYVELRGHFNSTEDVYRSGVDCFRDITRNKTPTGLAQVLHCILIADALSSQTPHLGNELQLDFVNDLGRWKTPLCEFEKTMFDRIVREVWEVEHVPMMDGQDTGKEELYQFQALIQNLVSLEGGNNQVPVAHGLRLRTVQKQVRGRNRNSLRPFRPRRPRPSTSNSFQNIGSVLGQLTMDTDTDYEDDLDLSDFVHLDAFGIESSRRKTGRYDMLPSGAQWKDVHPAVVLLLASVAFSIVLTTISAIQDGGNGHPSSAFLRTPPSYARSSAIVEEFLSFKDDDASVYDSGIDLRPPFESQRSPWMWEMKKASQRNARLQSVNTGASSLASSPQLATVRASMSSPSGSSFISTDFSSPDTARSSERRFKCTSLQCPKTFSSVSNRNKHVREGCAFRDKKGYRCRNDNCTKVLTTKWYRNTHEQTRCRFKKVVDD